jgi:hypothetical protein
MYSTDWRVSWIEIAFLRVACLTLAGVCLWLLRDRRRQMAATSKGGNDQSTGTGKSAGPVVPNNSLQASDVYPVLMALVQGAEEIRWTRLYNLSVVNTLFVLAWSAVFTSYHESRVPVLIVLALPGLVFSVLWIPLGQRSSDFVDTYYNLALRAESSFPPGVPRAYEEIRDIRDTAKKGWKRFSSSRLIMSRVPAVFVVMFLVLTAVSVLQVFVS